MANRAETLQNLLASLKTPDSVNAEALTEDAVFMALAVNVRAGTTSWAE